MYVNYLYFKEVPLLRIFLVYTLGSALGQLFPLPSLSNAILFSIPVLLSHAIFLRINYQHEHLNKQVKRVSSNLFTTVFLAAYSLAMVSSQHTKNHLTQLPITESQVLQVELSSTVIEKANTYQVQGKVRYQLEHNTYTPCSGKVILYIAKNSKSQSLQQGDEIYARLKLKLIEQPKNPYQFSYANYLSALGIYHSAYIDSYELSKPSMKPKLTFKGVIEKSQIYLQQALSKVVEDQEALSVASALLLGDKSLLDGDTKSIYAHSGAMHVLAVSGLHVGIIYLILSQILFFIPKKKILKALLLIIGIWFYTAITGGSPSVLRAATMFTFIAIGRSLKQHVNIYNMLAASALLLSIIQPSLLFNIGFQLSYTAVLGILYFQKRIYNLYISSNWFIDKLWMLSSVSFAAQIGTLPLSLYYFHQFPVYFWISNLLVIPLATLIVYLGVGIFISSPLPIISQFIGRILNFTVKTLNNFLSYLGQLPFALSEGWHLSVFELFCAYAILLLFIGAIGYRQKTLLKAALVLVLALTTSFTTKKLSSSISHDFTVYHSYKHPILEFRSGLSSFILTTSPKNERSALFKAININILAKQVKKQEIQTIEPGLQLYNFANTNFLVVNQSVPSIPDSTSVDYVIFCKQSKLNLKDFSPQVQAKTYVFDATNKSYLYGTWKTACKDLNLNCYFVHDSIAFEQKLK